LQKGNLHLKKYSRELPSAKRFFYGQILSCFLLDLQNRFERSWMLSRRICSSLENQCIVLILLSSLMIRFLSIKLLLCSENLPKCKIFCPPQKIAKRFFFLNPQFENISNKTFLHRVKCFFQKSVFPNLYSYISN